MKSKTDGEATTKGRQCAPNRSASSRGSVHNSSILCASRASIAVYLTVTLFVQPTVGDMLFHQREHSDQRVYQPYKHASTVASQHDALHYLNKYGYINCTDRVGRPRRSSHPYYPGSSASIIREGTHSAGSSRRAGRCTQAQVHDGLVKLQETFNLRPTGQLDGATIATMNLGRCGNKDQVRMTDVIDDLGTGSGRRSNGIQDRMRNHRRIDPDAAAAAAADRVEPFRRKRSVTLSDLIRKARSNPKKTKSGDVVNIEAAHMDARDRDGMSMHPVENDNESWNSVNRRRQMLKTLEDRFKRQRHHVDPGQKYNGSSRSAVDRVSRKRRSMKTMFGDRLSEANSSNPGDGRATRLQEIVRWRLLWEATSSKIPLAAQKAALELAFRMWSEVIPLKFAEDNQLDVTSIDILIAFGKGKHWNCDRPFDGPGGELAHSWSAGDIHLDDEEEYKKDASGIDLLKVAVHEVGHVLGLLHSVHQQSIMFPIYISPASQEDIELTREDRDAAQQIYGVCKGQFDLVLDQVRRSQDSNEKRNKYIYHTYFFRGSHLWSYENRNNRTRYGDPSYISREWPGLPSKLDAGTQAVIPNGDEYNLHTYFFKGDLYYEIDGENNTVKSGFPRRISDEFGPKSGQNETVPDDLDAVWFNEQTRMMYFFKGDWVWIYDHGEIGKNGCCASKQRFDHLFPMLDPTDPDPLTGSITTVYHAYFFRTTFMFKNEMVYEIVTNAATSPSSFGIRQMAPWYNIWLDICDVD